MAIGAALLAACGGSSTPTAAPEAPAGLTFEPASSLAIKQGSIHEVVLSLDKSASATGQSVRVATSNLAIADVMPSSCTLSGASEASRRCLLTVRGKALGSVTLSAQSPGLPTIQIPATVDTAVIHGQLAISNASGSFVTTPTASATFPAGATAPFQFPLKAKIVNSSGLSASAGAVIRFSSTTAGVTFTLAQCAVTTLAPECDTVASLPSAAATPIVVSASSSQASSYSNITVNATAAPPANNGTITLSTQSGNQVPNGMKAPLFVQWSNPAVSDTVTVALTIQGTGVSFYSYPAGNNTSATKTQTQSCTLTYLGAGQAGNALSCGLGLVGSAISGNVTVTATVSSATQQAYSIGSLVLGAVAPEPTVRAITFTNSSTQTIYVGVTGGAATAYVSATKPAVSPGQTTANLKPGAGSLCGPSNPQAACPMGTTCLQGGSSPNTDYTKSPYFCYYDQNAPSNGHTIGAAAGTTTTVLEISGSSLAPNGVIWSGNFYPRTGCDPTTGVCENATCKGTAGGLVCGPGTGPSPGTNTLAEVTFQAYPGPDFYDVSIINGANFGTAFGPTNATVSSSNSYSCGTAGSAQAQNGGYSASGIGLPAASWTMAPTTASFPPGVTLDGDPASYFRLVAPTASPATQCTTAAGTCTDGVNTTCGYAMSDVVTGASFAYDKRYCGKPVAWLTADAIHGFNATSTNVAPFSLSTSWPNGNGGTVSVGDLQLCINGTYSSYIANLNGSGGPIQPVDLACGGVMWGSTQSTPPLGNPSGNNGLGLTYPNQANPVQTANPNWLSHVLPTITWLKQACPSCYTYPFDDMSSTFTCADSSSNASLNYGVTFSDLN
ncbi:MAG TPA: thaumatin family protein [Burkholderiaceae bacterium]|nr:thaumatin family protein [Burkholderiaceae bacterium]